YDPAGRRPGRRDRIRSQQAGRNAAQASGRVAHEGARLERTDRSPGRDPRRVRGHAACAAMTESYRSQNGEDRWLEAHFGGKRSGFFVEVGAYDGVNLSNTYHFEQTGWTGVLVEPDPEMA